MTLLYSGVEEELRAAVRALLADRLPPAAVLAGVESAPPYDPGLWKALARDIGTAGLLIPERFGGAGASAREAAVVLEELGRAVTPVPFLTSAVLATGALLGAESEAAGGLLASLAAGDTTAALAVSLATSPYRAPDAPWPVTQSRGRLSGRVTAVAGAEAADVLLVPAGTALYAVAAGEVRVEPVVSLDLTRPIATVTLEDAPATPVADGPAPLRAALELGAGLLASEQLGVAEWCLETTLAHVRTRYQFARPIGSFQALKHRLADLWLEIVQARAAARNAADALATAMERGTAAATEVAVAQAWCGTVAVRAAEECVQMHGGLGMTWEHPAHLFLKRAKAGEIALGTPGDHRAALAVLADLPGPA
ncbi:acyl-CoA dehydrogenase [Sphaerisporangium siamense]|uniref:Alkylation response protein AidB-like acyl-CoA dehydrogenase n=1 Tax=Sphaerisporangium siamense TaxID=795645 RepID=A0A7W7D9S2_9ACTN|nr:acyl-CoA dehydrogenase family protein [Sphaerisporangium siamense]MBB4701601.1 alkylation response protein AidB-like acyl-CoA dehydrogenase [Sphaerisporangium siamense]GII85726.1 acyl-CoA dehydrogenase [Sphaerisporangium siamense]